MDVDRLLPLDDMGKRRDGKMLTLENIAHLRAIAKADTNGAHGKAWDEAVTPEVVIALCDALEQARALMWVNKPPKVPGWYFCYRKPGKRTKFVYPMRVVHAHYLECAGVMELCIGRCWYDDEAQEDGYPIRDLGELTKKETWWTGPIPEPREPK